MVHFREVQTAPAAKAAPTFSGVSDVLSALSLAQSKFVSTRILDDEGEAFLRRRPLNRQLEIRQAYIESSFVVPSGLDASFRVAMVAHKVVLPMLR